jgi:acetoin utilization protein AcuB
MVFSKKKKTIKKNVKKVSNLVSNLMTRKLISVAPSTTLDEVYNIFIENKIRGAPVFSYGFFIGEISRSDILKVIDKESLDDIKDIDKKALQQHKVVEVMKRPICIFENADIDEAKLKMKKYNIGRVFVIDKNKKLCGIITKNDLMNENAPKRNMKTTISTQVDEILNILEKRPLDISKLSKLLEIPETLIEQWAKVLEEHGMIDISYPVVGSPILKLKKAKEKA